MDWRDFRGGWPEYVPVHKRRAQAEARAAKQAKRAGREPEPVHILGRGIATTFWGQSWCKNLESYSDISNRLPRGKTYARNGSVVDLVVTRGRVEAVVAGSMVYDIAFAISPIAPEKWRAIKRDCATSIGSLIDLLSGRLADDVMKRLVKPGEGMFPSPREINVKCSCPDGARICKHIAAVFYGIGHRLDSKPDLLFLLRGVDQTDLVAAATKESVSRAVRGMSAHALADDDLSEIFGIDLGASTPMDVPAASLRSTQPADRKQPAKVKKPSRKAPAKKNAPAKKKAVAKKKPTGKPKTASARTSAASRKTAATKMARRTKQR
jgi:uncharacterized Zn finger protein